MNDYKFIQCQSSEAVFAEVVDLLYAGNPLRTQQKESIQEDYLHKCFVLLNKNIPVGRFAIYNNPHLFYNNLKAVCIGNYECENNQHSSNLLLNKAIEECKSLNAEYIIGPMNGSTWYDYRFRKDPSPVLFTTETFHHDYYSRQFEDFGFSSIANYISARDEQMLTDNDSVIKREKYFKEQNIRIRQIDLGRFEEEMRDLFDFCIKAFKNNFLYTPISFKDFFSKYLPIQKLLNPEHILIAEDNDEIVGLLFCIDNFNNKSQKELIVKTLAVKEGIRYAGLGKVLLNEIISNAKNDYQSIIHAFIIESGISANVSKHLNGIVFQRYTLYGINPDTKNFHAEQNNIVSYFFETANIFPDKTAIKHLDRSISFKELKRSVGNYSLYLKNNGIEKDDRILVFVPMSIELYAIVIAIFNVGATAVFIDEWASFNRLNLCCKHADCKGVVLTKKLKAISFLFKEIRKIPVKLNSSTSIVSETIQTASVSGNDTALITFTTGSTGIPKAANRTHQFLQAQYEIIKEHTKSSSDDIELTTFPVFLLMNLGIGTTSIIANFNQKKPQQLDPERVIKQITENNINKITASPYFIEKLANHILQEHKPLSSIKKIFTGGAPVFPSTAEKFKNAFDESLIEITYGSTESEPISSVNADELISQNIIKDNGLLVGAVNENIQIVIIPIQTTPIELLNKTMTDIQLPIGSIGEIAVAGRHVLKDYFRNEEAFKQNKINENGKIWHRTGDSGFIGTDGLLYLTGRCANLIHIHGKIISPFIAEYIISQQEGIRCGTVIYSNNKTIAIIELSDKNISSETALKKLKLQIPEIEELKIVKNIPRDPRHFSKIDYQKLIQ